MDIQKRMLIAEEAMGTFISALYGTEDWKNNPSMEDTAKRVAKMFFKDFCARKFTERPKMSCFVKEDASEGQLVSLGNIAFTSMCEHHFLPIYGKAYIGYIPKGKILGLSKFSRLVQWLAKCPSLQEKLTTEIGDSLVDLIGEDVVVILKARHDCCNLRGVADRDMITTTTYRSGVFLKDPETLKYFFETLKL
jgi:GTP cyclohydrolase I